MPRWSDVFVATMRRRQGNSRSKTTRSDQITWAGIYCNRKVVVVSTVRLCYGNLAHFILNSGARIGCHDWNLRGGHYVDLAVQTSPPLSNDELRQLARLAATEEARPVRARRYGELLDQGVTP